MTQPGTPGGQIPVTDLDGLARRLRDMERRIRELESTAIGPNGLVVGSGYGIAVNGGGDIVVDGGQIRSANFDGDLDTLDVGTEGWALGGPSNVAALATLLLRPGSVGNDALTNPVDFGAYGGSGVAWPVNTTPAAVKSGTIAVPSGYTRAVVMCNAHASATNTSASTDYLYTSARIDASGGGPLFNVAAPDSQTHSGSSAIRTLTGLAPSSFITVACQVNSMIGNWPAEPSNAATVDAIAVFLR